MRIEDEKLLTGRGTFAADLRPAGRLHAAILRSPHPHARLLHVDLAAARGAPGVVAALAAADLGTTHPLPPMTAPNELFAQAVQLEFHEPPVPLLADGRLLYVGQPVAVVVAASRAEAEDALELVEIDAEPLPVVVEIEDALHGPELHEGVPGNVAACLELRRGGTPPSAPDCTVRTRLRIGRHSSVPIEARGVVAVPDAVRGRIELYTSTQVPHRVRTSICAALGWPEDRMRVITPDVGGGFGTKANVYPEEAIIAFCADALGRPVAWIEDRTEHLVAAAQSRDQIHDVELKVAADGNILSYRDDFSVNLGAHNLWMVGVIANTALHATGPYKVPSLHVTGRALVTNKAPSAQYRGAGRPEACFALERALDMAARRLGLDRFEIRRRNLIRPEDMPYEAGYPQRDGMPVVLANSDYPAVLDRALELAEPATWAGLRAEAESHGERFGTGCATYIEATGRGPFEGAVVRVRTDGTVDVASGAASAGQGHHTTLARVCANVLGIDPSRVRVITGDTDAIPRGVGTFASRTAVVAGNAVLAASREVLERARELAAEALGCQTSTVVWAQGRASAEGGGSIGLAELAAVPGPEAPLEACVYFEPRTVEWTMGAHVAAVGVDSRTGRFRILRYAAAHDTADVLDEKIVEGQFLGGIVQGLGGALLEEFRYSAEGQPLSTTFADYLLPTASDVPTIRLGEVTAPADNPLNLKGVGESGIIAVAAVLANAISDALGGADLNETPLRPAAIWRAAQ
jgi:carbon-monoxide dehydrogenase large subunit